MVGLSMWLISQVIFLFEDCPNDGVCLFKLLKTQRLTRYLPLLWRRYFSKRVITPQVFWLCMLWETLVWVALNIFNWNYAGNRSWVCHETYKCEWAWEHTCISLQVRPISISSGILVMKFSFLTLMFSLTWLIWNLLYMHTSCSCRIKPWKYCFPCWNMKWGFNKPWHKMIKSQNMDTIVIWRKC